MLWITINTQVRQTYPYKISNSHIFLQDEIAHLDELTELEDP